MASMSRCLAVFIALASILVSLTPSSLVVTAAPLSSSGRGTLYVGGTGPGNYTRIQDAVDDASAGDTIYVYHGTYAERVLITKPLTLVGESATETIISTNDSGNVIKIQGTADVTVTQFTLQGGGIGAYLVQATRAHILHCIVTDNYDGVDLLNSSSCEITGNFITHLGFDGINPTHSTGTIITGNLIVNYLDGIYLVDSTGSIVTGNTLRGNSRGIEVQESSNGNQFYHNNFFQNSQDNAYDTCSNTWDNGYPSGGNYWDDYHGSDGNHDGIGDTPYAIAGGSNRDHYPFMAPLNMPPDKPSAPDPVDGATHVALNPVLSVFVYDPDGDAMSVSFYDASTQQLIGTDTNVPSSSRASVPWNGLASNIQYHWYAIAGDGSYSNQSDTWTFTTGNGTNLPPTTPAINGPASGAAGQSYPYTFLSTDPEGSSISYYIDWDDGTPSSWIGPFDSGQLITVNHTWAKRGFYTIQAKAKDAQGAESGWGTLSVRMPVSYTTPSPLWVRLLEYLNRLLTELCRKILIPLFGMQGDIRYI